MNDLGNIVNTNGYVEDDRVEEVANFVRRCSRKDGAKTYVSRKKTMKYNAKKFAMSSLLTFSLLCTTFSAVKSSDMWKPIQRKIDLKNANEYVSEEMISYLNEANVDYVPEKGNTLISDNKEQLKNLQEVLESKGFVGDVACYAVYKSCGYDALEKYVTVYGYRNVYDFMTRKAYTTEYYLDFNTFENNVEVEYVATVDELKDKDKSMGL